MAGFQQLAIACAAALLPILPLGFAPAQAETRVVENGTSDALVAPLLLAVVSAEPARTGITIGRGQDIVGAPVDFARMPPPQSVGSSGKGLASLPSRVSLPTVLPVSGQLTSRYGVRWHPIRGGYRAHSGIDLAAPMGSPVYAPAAGIVQSVGWEGGYGLAVTIAHGGGMTTRYGHLSRQAVVAGQAVAAGTPIGFVGSTGLSTGPHLHYEIRKDGVAVDPLSGQKR